MRLRPSRVRSGAWRSNVLSLAKAISIGFMSGELLRELLVLGALTSLLMIVKPLDRRACPGARLHGRRADAARLVIRFSRFRTGAEASRRES
jgi:hypothetical protein